MVDFTNILRVAFAAISFCQKITNTNCKYKKAKSTEKLLKTFWNKKAVCEMLVKLTPRISFKKLDFSPKSLTRSVLQKKYFQLQTGLAF